MLTVIAIATIIALLAGMVGALIAVFLVPWAMIFSLTNEKPKEDQ